MSTDKVSGGGSPIEPSQTKGFYSKDGDLFIDGKKVLKAWESFSGWYWFGVEIIQKQDSDMGDGTVIKDDTIWFGFVQGQENEWGDFSQGEIEALAPKVWEIKKQDLPSAGRR